MKKTLTRNYNKNEFNHNTLVYVLQSVSTNE